MHASLCICDLVVRHQTRTRLLLVIHRCEARKPTNTGKMAAQCLTNSEVLVRGHEGSPTEPVVFGPETQPLFLFPFEGAKPITDYLVWPKPITLIVPDGNWRQASKVQKRVGGFRDVPCVSLPPGPPSLYRLRAEVHDGRLATIEAIARAMGLLEGAEVQAAIERVFLALVERTLWARGEVDTKDVTSGVPAGAMRHDPDSGRAREVT